MLISHTVPCFSGTIGSPPPGLPPGLADHGVGVGTDQARRVTIPLGQDLAVIISRDARDASRLRTADLNRFTVFNSREFVAHAPDWPNVHPDLAVDLRLHLRQQRLVAPLFLGTYGSPTRNAASS